MVGAVVLAWKGRPLDTGNDESILFDVYAGVRGRELLVYWSCEGRRIMGLGHGPSNGKR